MEGEHITPRAVGETAAKAGVKSIVTTHLGPTIDPADNHQRYIDGAREIYAGPINIAKDLMSSKTPASTDSRPSPPPKSGLLDFGTFKKSN